MNLTQKRATLVDRSAGECVLLRSPFVVVDISLRSRGISQIKAAACHYDASWIHLRRLSITSRKTTFATFGSTSYLNPEASDCSYDATATTTTSLATVAPNNANPINPCSTANPNNLDYSTTNAQQHILQNHTPGGKGPSFYVGDWTAISLFNQATLTQGYLAPPQFQRAGTYTLQWTAPPLMFPLNLIWPGPYIGTGQTGQQTGTNRLVVKTNCSTVITSYPVTP
jgi:hypothetical protein